MTVCQMKQCSRRKDISPTTHLCPTCEASITGRVRETNRQSSMERRDSARSSTQNSNRNISPDPENLVDFPPIDIDAAKKTFEEIGDEDPKDRALKYMFGMMISTSSKIQKLDNLEVKVDSLESRMESLESKVGGEEDIAVPLGLAIRNLPIPVNGSSELQQVKFVLGQIGA